MPPQEIRAVLAADDPVLVRRLLELHRERLEEWIDGQRGLVSDIERSLTGEHGAIRPDGTDLVRYFGDAAFPV